MTRRIPVFLLALALGAQPALAGDPVPGVDIALEQIPGGVVARGTSAGDGTVTFPAVAPGTYRVIVAAPSGKAPASAVTVSLAGAVRARPAAPPPGGPGPAGIKIEMEDIHQTMTPARVPASKDTSAGPAAIKGEATDDKHRHELSAQRSSGGSVMRIPATAWAGGSPWSIFEVTSAQALTLTVVKSGAATPAAAPVENHNSSRSNRSN